MIIYSKGSRKDDWIHLNRIFYNCMQSSFSFFFNKQLNLSHIQFKLERHIYIYILEHIFPIARNYIFFFSRIRVFSWFSVCIIQASHSLGVIRTRARKRLYARFRLMFCGFTTHKKQAHLHTHTPRRHGNVARRRRHICIGQHSYIYIYI